MVTTFSLHEAPWLESVIWVTVAFIIFFLIFGKLLWRTLAGMLDARAQTIRTTLDEATKLRLEAEAMLKDAEARRAAALADAKALLAGAKAEAERVAQAAAAEAQESARRRESMAIQRIAAAEKAAVGEVRLAAMEVASAAVTEVIGRELDAAADATLINRAIAQLPAAMTRKVV